MNNPRNEILQKKKTIEISTNITIYILTIKPVCLSGCGRTWSETGCRRLYLAAWGREEKEGTERKLVRVIDFLIAVVVKDFSAAVWWDGQGRELDDPVGRLKRHCRYPNPREVLKNRVNTNGWRRY